MTNRLVTEPELEAAAAELARKSQGGDVVLLSGLLGAGKTTFARAFLHALGWKSAVRSPTFNLLNVFETHPPVLHADLYRLQSTSSQALGLSDYASDHILLIEWPDRLTDSLGPATSVNIEFADDPTRRSLTIMPPNPAIG